MRFNTNIITVLNIRITMENFNTIVGKVAFILKVQPNFKTILINIEQKLMVRELFQNNTYYSKKSEKGYLFVI